MSPFEILVAFLFEMSVKHYTPGVPVIFLSIRCILAGGLLCNFLVCPGNSNTAGGASEFLCGLVGCLTSPIAGVKRPGNR